MKSNANARHIHLCNFVSYIDNNDKKQRKYMTAVYGQINNAAVGMKHVRDMAWMAEWTAMRTNNHPQRRCTYGLYVHV